MLFSYDVIEKCHTSWIINEDIVNLKNEHDFWVSHVTNVARTKFYQHSSLISKVTRASFKVKNTMVKLGQEWRHACPSFTRGTFNFKRKPHNFWNNGARLIKFGTCNISGMRNSKIMFIFQIDNVFIYYSWGVTFLNDVITKKQKAITFELEQLLSCDFLQSSSFFMLFSCFHRRSRNGYFQIQDRWLDFPFKQISGVRQLCW